MSRNMPTAKIQSEFAQACRSGSIPQIQGIHSKSRVKVYHNLITNIFSNTLDKAFPIAKRLLDNQWPKITGEFIATGNSRTPALWMMPRDFVDYAIDQKIAERLNLPFLEDLLLFEWMEIYIYMMEDGQVPPNMQAITDLENQILVLNPDATIVPLKYAVFRPIPQSREVAAGEFYLLTYRHPTHLNVHFIELQPLFVLALEYLTTGVTGTRLIEKLRQAAPGIAEKDVETKTLEFLEAMVEQGVIIGARHPCS